jgi:beta-galactosidase beta subunit
VIFPLELHRPMCTFGVPSPLRKIVVKIDSALLVD